MAVVALVELARVQHAMLGMTTDRANEAVRPTPPEQRLGAAFLSAKLLHKTVQTQAFLKLDGILFHGSTPRLSARFQYADPGGSEAEPA